MATQTVKMVIQLRRASTAEWEQYKDVVPAAGEPCFDYELNTLKIGDGTKKYHELTAIGGTGGVSVAADGTSIILKDGVFQLVGFDAAEVGAQPRKGLNGEIEWFIPTEVSTEDLEKDVASLQTKVATLEQKMDGTGEGSVDAKIDAKINEFATNVTDDKVVNSYKELIDYVAEHGGEAAEMAADIASLKQLVGEEAVSVQIDNAMKASGHITKTEAEATFLSKADAESTLMTKEDANALLYKDEAKATVEHVKYEIATKPVGTVVSYRDGEIRVLCPENTKWEKQTVGATGNANMYYMGFKAYAPDGAVSFKEGDQGVIIDEMFDFNGDFAGTDEFGRNYSICWLALASYNEASDTWTYFGKNSSVNKYIGWTYCVEWYDANGVMIESDCVRINLSNETCHNVVEPYYMSSVVKVSDIMIMDGGSAAG